MSNKIKINSRKNYLNSVVFLFLGILISGLSLFLFVPTVKAADPVITITDTLATRYSNVIIRYTLSDADDNTPCGLSVAYATADDNYTSWTVATHDTSAIDSGTSPACESSAAAYTFAWDASADLTHWRGNVKIRLSVTDTGLETGTATSNAFAYNNITSRAQGLTLPIHGSPADWQAKVTSNSIEYSGRLIGLENVDLAKVYRMINNKMVEIVSLTDISHDLNHIYSFTESNLEPETDYQYYVGLINSLEKTPLYPLPLVTTLAKTEDDNLAKSLANVSLDLAVSCLPPESGFNNTFGGFGLVNVALANSLDVVSSTSNFLIGIFALFLLISLILLVRNLATRPHWKHLKLLPALAWKKPADTFSQLASTDGEGSWCASYTRHRIYHQSGTASFWGVFTSLAVKTAAVVIFSVLASQGGYSQAQETVDCQSARVGDILTYKITIKNNGHEKIKALAVSNPLPAGTALVDNSAYCHNCEITVDEGILKTSTDLSSSDVFSLLYNVRLTEPGRIKNIAYASYLNDIKSDEVDILSLGNPAVKPVVEPPLTEPSLPTESVDHPSSRPSDNASGNANIDSGRGTSQGSGETRIVKATTKTDNQEKQPDGLIKVRIKVSGENVGNFRQMYLIIQSEPIIKTFTPSGDSWEYETDVPLSVGEHTIIISGKDESGNTVNQIGPIAFMVDEPGAKANAIIPPEEVSSIKLLKDSLLDFIDNPSVEEINEQTIAPILAAIALTNAVTAIPLINLLPYLQYLFTEPFSVLRRRRRRGWGIVYNSLTKQPVDLAVVRLYSKDTNKLIQTRVTDRQGRYLFVVKEPGKYHITAAKPEHLFPSKFLKSKKEDGRFLDLYYSQSIVVKPGGKEGIITVNIPIDPSKSDKPSKKVIAMYVTRRTQNLIASFGLLLSVGTCIISPKALIILLFLIHLSLYLLFQRLAYPKRPKSWGVVYNKINRHPLAQAVVKIYDRQFDRLLESQVTDEVGRYSFLVGNNVYYLTADKPGYNKTQTDDIDLKNQDKGSVVGLDIGLKKSV